MHRACILLLFTYFSIAITYLALHSVHLLPPSPLLVSGPHRQLHMLKLEEAAIVIHYDFIPAASTTNCVFHNTSHFYTFNKCSCSRVLCTVFIQRLLCLFIRDYLLTLFSDIYSFLKPIDRTIYKYDNHCIILFYVYLNIDTVYGIFRSEKYSI